VTELLLVRHGQSTWNAQARWQGREDPPLSATGMRQARWAARSIGQVDALLASPLDRARTTAELIGTELGIGPVLVLDGLIERHCGAWQGLTSDEIEATWPGALGARRFPEGWEPDDDVVPRALAAIQAAALTYPGAQLVGVTHGGVLRALHRALGGRTEAPGFPNLAGYRLALADDARLLDAVHLLDEHAHAAIAGEEAAT